MVWCDVMGAFICSYLSLSRFLVLFFSPVFFVSSLACVVCGGRIVFFFKISLRMHDGLESDNDGSFRMWWSLRVA